LDGGVKLSLDTGDGSLHVSDVDRNENLSLYSPEAFKVLSQIWIKVGWSLKYTYSFTWMGRPIIQLPEDMVRIQEVLFAVRPDVVIETGVAHGGSLIFYASLFRAMGHGRVIGVDVEIRPHNRKAIEEHPLSSLVTLFEGDSVAEDTLDRVRSCIRPGEHVLVLLDSNHSKAHVLAELETYAPLVTPGSYIVATDGLMEFLDDAPRGQASWRTDNPKAAAEEFAEKHPEFIPGPPPLAFNEGSIQDPVTHWPGAYLRRQ
jgi:cephalosporin hydroxylase